MKIELTEQELTYIFNTLTSRPYSEVHQLIPNLQKQYQEQTVAPNPEECK